MNTMQLTFKRVIRLALAAVLTAFIMAPTSALAATAAGTVIRNTATVTWDGGAGNSDFVEVTVALKPTLPTLVFTSTAPASASDSATGVGALTLVTVKYTITSGANGLDTYSLSWANPQPDTGVSAATLDPNTTNATSIATLGGSMVISNTGTAITVAGLAVHHGLADGDTILIGAETFTLSNAAVNGTNTDFTLSVAPATDFTAGTPIYEQQEIDLELTTGTLSAATGNHDLNLTATSTTDAAATATTPNHKIYVAGTSLAITKTATTPDGGTQPGQHIEYSIEVENTGTNNATNVVITDPIPQFTNFTSITDADGCTVDYSSTPSPGYTWGSAGDATAEVVKFECGTLAGGAIKTVIFQVVIE